MRRIVTAVTVLFLSVSVRADIEGVTSRDISPPSSQANPNYMVVGPDGKVWFTDTVHRLVGNMVVSGTSATVATFPLQPPPGQGAIDIVGGITVGPDNALWFTFRGCPTSACGAGRLQNLGRITTDGSQSAVQLQGIPNPGLAQGAPSSIVAGPDGNFWMVYGTSTILRVTTAGAVTVLTPPKSDAVWITVGPDQNLWYLGRSVVGRVTPSGTFTEFTLPSGATGSGNLAFDSSGNIWFPSGGAGTVTRMTQAGSFLSYVTPSQSTPTWVVPFADGTVWYTQRSLVIGRITVATGRVDEQALLGSPGTGKQLLVLPSSVGALSLRTLDDAKTTVLRNGSDPSSGSVVHRIDIPGSATGDPDLKVELRHFVTGAGTLLPGGAPLGAEVWLEAIVTNVGGAPTKGVWKVHFTYNPDIYDGVGARDPNCLFERPSSTRGDFSCDYDTPLAPGKTLVVRFNLGLQSRPLEDRFENVVTVSGGGDKNLTNNTSNTDVYNYNVGDLTISKFHQIENGKLYWVISVVNNDREKAAGPIIVQDRLPPGVSLNSVTGTAPNDPNDDSDVDCHVENNVLLCTTRNPIRPFRDRRIVLEVEGYPTGAVNIASVSAPDRPPAESEPDVLDARNAIPLPPALITTTLGGHR